MSKKVVIISCSKNRTPEVEFVEKEVETFDITKVEIPDNAVDFWFQEFDENGIKKSTKVTTIGRLFTRKEIKKMSVIDERLANLAKWIEQSDYDGAILTKAGMWQWYYKGDRYVDLL